MCDRAWHRRRKQLIKADARWKKSRELTDFLDALESALGEKDENREEIVTWARQVAQDMNPLNVPPETLVSKLGFE